jgi:hypothetical protein
MLRTRGLARMSPCALVLLAASVLIAMSARSVADDQPQWLPTPQEAIVDAPSSGDVGPPSELTPDETPGEVITIEHELAGDELTIQYPDWSWRWLPVGLIYHSYMAGVHEPRLALVTVSNLDGRKLWDPTLGGRVGLLQYGNGDPVFPVGYQLDFYGAAIARLDVDNEQDLDSTDYVFGFPLTWGGERQQWKFGYAHTSSHLGDEFAIRNPGALGDRINYVRDSFVFGTSYYPTPSCRLYGEVGWAFHCSGGAEQLDGQFGTEYSQPGPTGSHFTPFVAANVRVREDQDFSGDVNLQAGWLRRNILGQTLRLGGQYYNGKSSQFQFASQYEQQLGVGIWYDF